MPRTYRARTFGEISQAQLEDLMDGVTVEGVLRSAYWESGRRRDCWIGAVLATEVSA